MKRSTTLIAIAAIAFLALALYSALKGKGVDVTEPANYDAVMREGKL